MFGYFFVTGLALSLCYICYSVKGYRERCNVMHSLGTLWYSGDTWAVAILILWLGSVYILTIFLCSYDVTCSKLLPQENCIQQGFNSGNQKGRARIGIVGDDSQCVAYPGNSFKSRIGFGASGTWYGMNNDNSCGNEYAGGPSIVAFGYIFVQ